MCVCVYRAAEIEAQANKDKLAKESPSSAESRQDTLHTQLEPETAPRGGILGIGVRAYIYLCPVRDPTCTLYCQDDGTLDVRLT